MEGLTPAYYTSAARTTVYRTGEVDVQDDWVRWESGYRLPTSEEWEYAGRGGLVSKRFPWGDTISHSQAPYYANNWSDYDLSSGGWHPAYIAEGYPHSAPAGAFAPNAYGLYDMAANVIEWCYDWRATGSTRRRLRGGSFFNDAYICRVGSLSSSNGPDIARDTIGLLVVLPIVP